MKYHFVLLVLCIAMLMGGCNNRSTTPAPTSAPESESQASTASDADSDEATEETPEAEETAEPADQDAEAEDADLAEESDGSGASEAAEDAAAEDAVAADAEQSPSALNSPLNSPLPTPPAPELETSSTTGAVTGQIIGLGTDGVYKPVVGHYIGLADIVQREDGEGDMAAAYDPSVSPFAELNEYGQFVLNDIEPGRYGIILDSGVNQALLSYPEGHEAGLGSVIVTVEADATVDVGRLQYDSLPIFGFTN